MGEELRKQESKIGQLENKTENTSDSLASLSNNAKKDFRLRGKCAAPCSPLGPARQSCGLAAAKPVTRQEIC
jgi:hypothetical protein